MKRQTTYFWYLVIPFYRKIEISIPHDNGWSELISFIFVKVLWTLMVGKRNLSSYSQRPPHWINYEFYYYFQGQLRIISLISSVIDNERNKVFGKIIFCYLSIESMVYRLLNPKLTVFPSSLRLTSQPTFDVSK